MSFRSGSRSGLSLFIAALLFLVTAYRAVVFGGLKGGVLIASLLCVSLILLLNASRLRVDRVHLIACSALFGWLLVSFVVNPTSIERFALGAWYTFAVFLYFTAFSQIRLSRERLYAFLKIVALVLATVCAIGLGQSLLGDRPVTDFSNALVFLRGQRSTLDSAIIFYAAIAFQLVFLLALQLRYRARMYLIGAVASSALVLATGSRKLIVAVLVTWVLWAVFVGARRRWIALLAIFLGAAVFLPFAMDMLVERFASLRLYYAEGAVSDVARNALYFNAIQIANDFFPFGGGMGMFGSAPAAQFYSPLYYDYGLSGVHGLQPFAIEAGAENYLMDALWPQVIGELGYVGGALFVFALMWPLRLVLRGRPADEIRGAARSDQDSRKPLRFLAIGIYTVVLIESSGSPLLTNPLGLYVIGGVVGLIVAALGHEDAGRTNGRFHTPSRFLGGY